MEFLWISQISIYRWFWSFYFAHKESNIPIPFWKWPRTKMHDIFLPWHCRESLTKEQRTLLDIKARWGQGPSPKPKLGSSRGILQLLWSSDFCLPFEYGDETSFQLFWACSTNANVCKKPHQGPRDRMAILNFGMDAACEVTKQLFGLSFYGYITICYCDRKSIIKDL